METIAGVILAGGQSRRMGQDKARVILGGQTLLDRAIERLAPQVGMLAVNGPQGPDGAVPLVPDSLPGQPGPLAGVLAAMDWAGGLGLPLVATCPVDLPFFPPDMVARLHAGGAPSYAQTADGLHPLCGLWPVGWADDLRLALSTGTRKVRDWTAAMGAVAIRFDTGTRLRFSTSTAPRI